MKLIFQLWPVAGWNIDVVEWQQGEDPAFFAALAAALAAGQLGPLNSQRVGFHGWSGGPPFTSCSPGVLVDTGTLSVHAAVQ